MIAVGGLAYTGGAVIYAMRKPDPWPLTFGYHEIFHALGFSNTMFLAARDSNGDNKGLLRLARVSDAGSGEGGH